jgi:hypothetical protein
MAINNQIIGGSFQDAAGNPLANGTLVFELSQDEQSPTPGQVGASRKIQVSLDSSGNVPSSPPVYVWANDSLNPLNSFYRVTAYSAIGQPIWGPQNQQVPSSPSPFSLGNWVPNSINLSATPAPSILLETNGTKNGSQALLDLHAGSGISLADNGAGRVTITTPTITLQTNEVANGSQTLLDLHAGAGVTLTDNGAGRITIASAGSAGSLSGSISLFASQGNTQSLDLSTEGVLDWFATINSVSGAAGGSQPAKGGASFSGLLRKGFVLTGFGGLFGPSGGSGLTMHSDAADSSGNALGNTNTFSSIGVGNNPTWLNWGFEIEAPASTQAIRDLNLYIPAINGTIGSSVTFKVIARLSDDSASEVDLTQLQTDTNEAVVSVYKANFQFKSAVAGARLRVQVFVSGITGSMQFVTIGLQCATLF